MNAIILAGGRSTRMGSDKAVLPFMGKPLINWLVERLRPVSGEVIVVSMDGKTHSGLGARVVGDIFPGKGPLGGLHAGLIASADDVNAVIACDMPFASPALLVHMASYADQSQAVVPVCNGRLQPLHAVYRKDCLPLIEQQLIAGNGRMADLLSSIHPHIVREAEVAFFGDPERIFFNTNTPTDFARALDLARSENGDWWAAV